MVTSPKLGSQESKRLQRIHPYPHPREAQRRLAGLGIEQLHVPQLQLRTEAVQAGADAAQDAPVHPGRR